MDYFNNLSGLYNGHNSQFLQTHEDNQQEADLFSPFLLLLKTEVSANANISGRTERHSYVCIRQYKQEGLAMSSATYFRLLIH